MKKGPPPPPRTIVKLPQEIVPGLRSHDGQHRVSGGATGMACNRRRELNLWRPGGVNLAPARRVGP